MKSGLHSGGLGFGGDSIDTGEGGTPMTAPQDFIERLLRAADHCLDAAVAKVAHPTVETQGIGLPDQPITKTDSLDPALDMDAQGGCISPVGGHVRRGK